ncbi:dehydroquinase class II [Bacteriovorax sp. Seq25_V]|nr:dehydroquinase class II [Bacteriovorax sp. Seq25_V]
MLGKREPEIYGKDSLADIEKYTEEMIEKHGLQADMKWQQSNSEEELISIIHDTFDSDFNGLVINPGAFSHTSIALLDALSMLKIPVIEVHLSNTNRREDFRKTKITAQSSTGVIEGLGKKVYYLAVMSLID